VTDLLPNLDDLIAALPANAAGADAAQLARGVGASRSWQEADDALDAVVNSWAAQ